LGSNRIGDLGSRGHLIPRSPFPVGGPSEPSLNLYRFPR